MQISIRDIGTSKGIIIPVSLLKEYGMTGAVQVEQFAEGIMLKPVATKKPREGWEEAAKLLSVSGKAPVIPDVFEDEDLSWWEWE